MSCELRAELQTPHLESPHDRWATIRPHTPPAPSKPPTAESRSQTEPDRPAPETGPRHSPVPHTTSARAALSVEDYGLVAATLHDLRSPLTIVSGRLQLLQMQIQHGKIDPARISAQLEEIAGAVAHMTTALDTLSVQANREE